MSIRVLNSKIYKNGVFRPVKELDIKALCEDIEYKNCFIIPGLADVHVHLREPGYSYKETIKSGTLAGAYGGYTVLCSMPNLDPCPDCLENLKVQTDIIEKDARVAVLPYGSISVGRKGRELADIAELAPFVVAFSDDGSGTESLDIMREAFLEAKKFGKIVASHCEDLRYLKEGGCVHEGRYSEANGLIGISSESEYKQLERDIALLRETGAFYHVCHVSAKESVALIRAAKKEGLDISAEVSPHHLLLCEDDLRDCGCFKMNPPLRSEEDRKALVEGIQDGTLDIIASDHAPHSFEEKSLGLKGSLMGIVGLETAFPLLYSELCLKGLISLEKLVELMSLNPRKRFKIKEDPGLCIVDPNAQYKIDSKEFKSLGKSTPFEGKIVSGKVLATLNHSGEAVCLREQI